MADPSDNPFKKFIGEIHRRSLWQVLGIYVFASWAVLGGVDTLGDALGLPDWFPRLALGLLIVGLPIVLATAFVQEGGRGHEVRGAGLDEAPEAQPEFEGASRTGGGWHIRAMSQVAAKYMFALSLGLGVVHRSLRPEDRTRFGHTTVGRFSISRPELLP